jgi:hypothetical protein
MTDVKDHIHKENVVKDYIKRFSIDTFIETGTYEGIMVNAIYPHVKQVYSIELDEKLHDFAWRNFKDNPNIRLYQGDSGVLLPGLLNTSVKEPCLFWLDAHYSAGITARGDTETPILAELKAIMASPYNHIILIDDARLYTGEGDWPTIDELKSIVHNAHPDWSFEVEGDIIRTHSNNDFVSMTTLGSYGRFGNQLFQYAALKTYAEKYNLRVEIPKDWTGRKVFADCNDPPITETPREQKMIDSKEPIWMNAELKNCDIKGYLQYHTSNYDKDYFRSLFRLKPELEDAMSTLYREIKGFNVLIAIHIRKGDYDIPTRRHNIAPVEWYLKWLKDNWSKLHNPKLFIASDEIEKAREDFKEYDPATFKDDNFLCDWYILQKADILLISNSTFSFTAAMLNEGLKCWRPDFEKKEMVLFDPWDSEPILKVEKPLMLHLGCGMQRHEGFINIDCMKTPATDLVCDIRQLPFENDSVDVIESFHVFEHIPVCLHANVSNEYGEKYGSLIEVLMEWRRVLKNNGQLVIEMPDLDKTFEQYLKADEAEKDRLLIPVYGSYRNNDDTDIHRWGANESRLRYILDKAGFRDIIFCEAQDYHVKDCPCLRAEAVK